jgi:hypothetical protein
VESYGTPEEISKYLSWKNVAAASFPLNFQLLNLCEKKGTCLSNIRIMSSFEPLTLKSLIDDWNNYKHVKNFWSNWEVYRLDYIHILKVNLNLKISAGKP